MYSPELQSMMWEILRTLSRIDADHNLRLEEVERSAAEEELKEYVRQKLTAAHRDKREPYVTRLEKLWQQQHRQSFGT
jgi:aminoglycoside phosphotransferase (APT) family kinase protein